jgi:hypothetical protein
VSVDDLRNRCGAIDRFIHRLVELELPLPDDGSPDGEWLALRWSETGVTFWFEPDADDPGVIDEFDAAILKGVDPTEWPYPTAEGYAEYVLPPRE